MSDDEFRGDTGLKDDFDGVISSAEFIQTQRGNWALQLKIEAEDGDEVEQQYSVGGADKGWTSYNGGETIEGATAKSRYHIQSSIQKFIDVVMKVDGAGQELKTRSARDFGKRGPFHAALWTGLKFHWDVVDEMKARQDQETKEWKDVPTPTMRPTKFIGVTGAPALPALSSAPTPSAASTNQEASDITTPDLTTLRILANQHEDHGAFADAVMQAKDSGGMLFLKNRPVMQKLADKQWYESLKA